MTQFAGGQMPLGTNLNPDGSLLQESTVTDDLLPSAGDASGLSPAIRQRLDSEVQSGGSADRVVAALRARIAEIDGQTLSEDDPNRTPLQAERALSVAQISYLEEHHGADPMSGYDTASNAGAVAPVRSTSSMTSQSMGGARRRARTYDTAR